MKIKFLCGCGTYNYNFQDWVSHFRYRGFWRGMRNLFLTKIEVSRSLDMPPIEEKSNLLFPRTALIRENDGSHIRGTGLVGNWVCLPKDDFVKANETVWRLCKALVTMIETHGELCKDKMRGLNDCEAVKSAKEVLISIKGVTHDSRD